MTLFFSWEFRYNPRCHICSKICDSWQCTEHLATRVCSLISFCGPLADVGSQKVSPKFFLLKFVYSLGLWTSAPVGHVYPLWKSGAGRQGSGGWIWGEGCRQQCQWRKPLACSATSRPLTEVLTLGVRPNGPWMSAGKMTSSLHQQQPWLTTRRSIANTESLILEDAANSAIHIVARGAVEVACDPRT